MNHNIINIRNNIENLLYSTLTQSLVTNQPEGRMREGGSRFGEMEREVVGQGRMGQFMDTLNYQITRIKKSSESCKITKYKFYNDSIQECSYCYEHLKKNDIICINSCYHYWCDNCNDKLKIDKCGFLQNPIESNEFIDTLGEKGFFEKNSHSLDLIQIIKDDIDLIQVDEFDDSNPGEIDSDTNDNHMYLID